MALNLDDGQKECLAIAAYEAARARKELERIQDRWSPGAIDGPTLPMLNATISLCAAVQIILDAFGIETPSA